MSKEAAIRLRACARACTFVCVPVCAWCVRVCGVGVCGVGVCVCAHELKMRAVFLLVRVSVCVCDASLSGGAHR